MKWWKIEARTMKDGVPQTGMLLVPDESPAAAFTRGEQLLLQMRGDGAILDGAWCYSWQPEDES
jgi:hypothetical protein